MFSHATMGTNDFSKAEPFYDAVMAALGHPVFFKTEDTLSYGQATGEKLFVVRPFDGRAAQAGNGVHLALLTDDRRKVDAFHAAALANGGADEGPPGLRPHYHPNYYGAYVRDPDGNKLQAVCHRRVEPA